MKHFISVLLIGLALTLMPTANAEETYFYKTEDFEAYKNAGTFPPSAYEGILDRSEVTSGVILPTGGSNGDAAFVIDGPASKSGTDAKVKAVAVPLDGKGITIVVDFNVLQLPDNPEAFNKGAYNAGANRHYMKFSVAKDNSNPALYVYYNTENQKFVMQTWANKQQGDVTVGEWYRLVNELDKKDATGAYAGTITVYNLRTGEQVLTDTVSLTADKIESDGSVKLHPVYMAKSEINGTATNGFKLALDNIEYFTREPIATGAPRILKSSISDADTGVRRNAEMKFVFDRAVSTYPTVCIGESPVAGATQKKLHNQVTLSFADALLAKKQSYNIKFDTVKSSADVACTAQDIGFVTEELHFLDDVVISSAALGSVDTSITFKADEPFDYKVISLKAIAAVYKDDKMQKFDIKDVTLSDNTEITQAFALGDLSQTTGCKISVMLIDTDSEGRIVPVAVGSYEVQ